MRLTKETAAKIVEMLRQPPVSLKQAARGLGEQQQALIVITDGTGLDGLASGEILTYDVDSLSWITRGDPVLVASFAGDLVEGDGVYGTCIGSISATSVFEAGCPCTVSVTMVHMVDTECAACPSAPDTLQVQLTNNTSTLEDFEMLHDPLFANCWQYTSGGGIIVRLCLCVGSDHGDFYYTLTVFNGSYQDDVDRVYIEAVCDPFSVIIENVKITSGQFTDMEISL